MPYRLKGNCVHKVNADDSLGEMVKCHDSEEDAKAHLAALNINVQESEPARATNCRELVDLAEATLDEDTYTIKGARLIKTGWSKNGRYYSADVLRKSAGLWEGVKAYADHPGKLDQKNRRERSVRDIVGIWKNPRYENQAVVADLRVVGEARTSVWPLIVDTIESGDPLVGNSINALGVTRKGKAQNRDGIIVEDITHANSVDVVTDPAAGGGFDNLQMSDDGWASAVIEALNIEELREARPDIIEALKREWKVVRDSAALVSARDKNKELAEQLQAVEKKVAELEQNNRTLRQQILAAKVDGLLATAKLPDEWKTTLGKQLRETDPKQWDGILEAEIKKAGTIRKQPVQVRGAGAIKPTSPTAKVGNAKNPVMEALGLDAVPREGETPHEFRKRRLKEQSNNG